MKPNHYANLKDFFLDYTNMNTWQKLIRYINTVSQYRNIIYKKELMVLGRNKKTMKKYISLLVNSYVLEVQYPGEYRVNWYIQKISQNSLKKSYSLEGMYELPRL